MALREIETWTSDVYYHAAGYPGAKDPKKDDYLFFSKKKVINTDFIVEIEEFTHGYVLARLSYGGGFEPMYLRMSIKEAINLLSS